MNDSYAWYRQPYLWMVLSPLIAVVIASFATLAIAIHSGGDSALPGEYRNAGKLIALDGEAHRRSLTIAPSVRGQLEPQSGRLELVFEGNLGLPAELQVMYLHPTLPARDQIATLQQTGNRLYSAQLRGPLAAGGEVHIYPADHLWRVVSGLSVQHALAFGASRR